MNEHIREIKKNADILRLTLLRDSAEDIIHSAQIDKPSYLEYTHSVLESEVKKRKRTDLDRRMKMAGLPRHHDLEHYDYKVSSSITEKQMKELRELLWVEQVYNLVLMGPSGTGKSFIAGGLIKDAVDRGFRAYFITMEDLVNILRIKEITVMTLAIYNLLLKAHLIAIDDIMLFPIKMNESVALFNLINHLHEQCSMIITTNKSPKQWAESMDDEILATAMLDRILYRCEVVKLDGQSYRMENRQSIFKEE